MRGNSASHSLNASIAASALAASLNSYLLSISLIRSNLSFIIASFNLRCFRNCKSPLQPSEGSQAIIDYDLTKLFVRLALIVGLCAGNEPPETVIAKAEAAAFPLFQNVVGVPNFRRRLRCRQSLLVSDHSASLVLTGPGRLAAWASCWPESAY